MSSSNARRNSVQALQCRKLRHQPKNYNFYNYWYLRAYQHQVIDQRNGTFNSVYAIYSCWAMFLLRVHIMGNDIDKTRMIRFAKWAAYNLLSTPYKVFSKPPKKPPDGIILSLVVLCFVCISCFWVLVNSFIMIFVTKLGLIYVPEDKKSDTNPEAPFVFTTVHVLTSQDLENRKAFSSFDSNAETALVDNCANTHIWNNRRNFITFRSLDTSKQGVSTIGGQPHFAEGVGDVKTSWKDDDGKVFQHTLKNVLYFSKSLVCIISCRKLSEEWGPKTDFYGTSIKTMHSHSVLNGITTNFLEQFSILIMAYQKWQ